jgi:hypothetical protein
MTSKTYKTAQGRTVDLGTIMLQNEHVRAVGNMNVNARGDRLDSENRVIETKNRQIQRQNDRTTNVTAGPVHTSNTKARQARANLDALQEQPEEGAVDESLNLDVQPLAEPAPVEDIPAGGLAAAIARSKIVKQEKEKTARELAKSTGVRRF